MRTPEWALSVLGRDEHEIVIPAEPLGTVMITGAGGSIGDALAAYLENSRLVTRVARTDIEELDVRDWALTAAQVRMTMPDVIFHLAGAKHAPHGESDPWSVTQTNVIGTLSVLSAAAGIPGPCRVVVASTCKACDPETAYGASKLIAERVTLNHDQRVARYYNVIESSGNVFEIWRNTQPFETLAYTHCTRRFMTMREAVALTVRAASLPSGRYTIMPTVPRTMLEVAQDLYPVSEPIEVPPRRGDRRVEPLHAACESIHEVEGSIGRVISAHDPPIDRR